MPTVPRQLKLRPFWTLLLLAGAFAAAAFAVSRAIDKKRQNDLRWERAAAETTGSLSQVATEYGPSGLPLPRFVSLKSAKVNVRRGPSSDHAVAWVFQRKGMPVEITAEFDNWRRIRDSEGQEGWILQQMLSGKRTAIVPQSAERAVILREGASAASSAVAQLAAGVSGDVESCNGQWCEVSAGGYDGYVPQERVWGVYPGEIVD
jgi:SH3-like domain-containing protein